MRADTVLEVVNKLIGEIRPMGASHLDDKGAENLKSFLTVWCKMHIQIEDIIYDNRNRGENSVVHMVDMCKEALNIVGVREY